MIPRAVRALRSPGSDRRTVATFLAIVVLVAIPFLTAAGLFVDRQSSDIAMTKRKSIGLVFDVRLQNVVAQLRNVRKGAFLGHDVRLTDRLAVERTLTRLYDYGSAAGRTLGVEKSLERLQNAWVAVPERGDGRAQIELTIAQALNVGRRIEERASLRSETDDVATDLLDAFAVQIPTIDERTDRQRNLLLAARSRKRPSDVALTISVLSEQARTAYDAAMGDLQRAAASQPSASVAVASLTRAGDAWAVFDHLVDRDGTARIDVLVRRSNELSSAMNAASGDVAREAQRALLVRLDAEDNAIRLSRILGVLAALFALMLGVFVWRSIVARDRRDLERAREEARRLEAERENERVREALALTEARFEAVFDRASIGIAIVDAAAVILRSNAALERMLPAAASAQLGTAKPDFARVFAGDLEGYTSECDVRRDGRLHWLESFISLVRDEAGAPLFAVAIVKDVTERHSIDDQLRYEATHDTLLQLPNRAYLVERMRETMLANVETENVPGVMFVDLDGFKVVNDSLGHEIGDRVLVAAARRLSSSVDPCDFVARFGGDEFVTLLHPRGSREETIEAANRVVRALAVPFDIDGREIFVTISAGLALVDRPYDAVEEILRDADTAMYHAKVSGGSRCAVFDAEMRDSATRRLELASQLRRALEREQIFLVFQPVVKLATGRIASFEVLVRWEHPELGLVAPGEFIPVAEELGLIVPIGRWVLERACAQLARWRADSHAFDSIYLAVNSSVRELLQNDYCAFVERTLERHGLRDGDLVLEVTETAVLQSDRYAQGTLQRLKEAGVGLAIDDFGTGYSSLRYLQHFPFDHLKIDASFVRGANGELASEAIVTMLLALGRSFGVNVIAEGVETTEQASMLRALGCTSVQGYLYGLPVASSLVRELLERRDTPLAS